MKDSMIHFNHQPTEVLNTAHMGFPIAHFISTLKNTPPPVDQGTWQPFAAELTASHSDVLLFFLVARQTVRWDPERYCGSMSLANCLWKIYGK